MRSIQVVRPGRFRISRRDSELYSVQIVSSGSWARARALDAAGNVLWEQPSTFTGSFWLGGSAPGGIIVEIASDREHEAANLTINWREKGRDIA
ncbi:MAG TPA: hypothetical protein VL614_14995 [Acetobacteraceae bacterium]|nr:hypothetical protein [Acetobacteraceae bacterium]